MGWVSDSHFGNFWAIWSVGWKETHVAPDIRYILPAAHTYAVFHKGVDVLLLKSYHVTTQKKVLMEVLCVNSPFLWLCCILKSVCVIDRKPTHPFVMKGTTKYTKLIVTVNKIKLYSYIERTQPASQQVLNIHVPKYTLQVVMSVMSADWTQDAFCEYFIMIWGDELSMVTDF